METLTFSEIRNVVDDKAKLYIFFHETLIDAKNPEQFEWLDKTLREAKEWTAMKEINELKHKLNYLFRNTVLNSYPIFMQLS